MKPRRGEVDLADMAVADMLRGEASEPSPLAKPGRGKAWARCYFRQVAALVRAGCPQPVAETTAAEWIDRSFMVLA